MGQSGSWFPPRKSHRRRTLSSCSCPHPHLPGKAPGVSVYPDLGDFLGRQDKRMAFSGYWPVIPRTPDQLCRSIPAFLQGRGELGLCCLCSQAAGLVGSAEARPELIAPGSGSRFPLRKPARGKVELLSSTPASTHPETLPSPASPALEKKEQRADPQKIQKNQYTLFGKKLNIISTQRFGQ